jgi:DNA-binding transcriptional LysR family regulator
MTRPADPVDLYLLRVLCTLVAERSVSRAAVKLNQSQPAISTSLKRLREIFNDPLLVREGAAMVPTERALQLRDSARLALDEIDRMVADPEQFDPASSQQTFNVASPDYLAMGFLAGAVEHLRAEAPRSRLVVHPLGPAYDYERALAQGELDVVIGNWPSPPERLHLSLLLEDEIVCLVSQRHPAAKRGFTPEQYLAAAHVVPAPYSMSQRGVVETHLASLRLARDARIVLPYFEIAPYLLLNTDLVFTTARHFAQHFARLLPLVIVPAPFDFPPMRFYQLWHDRSHQQASHRWLRELLSKSAGRLAGTKKARAGVLAH